MAQRRVTPPHFIRPGSIARAINRVYGSLTKRGLSMPYSFLVSVPGRRTGETRSVPVNLLQSNGKLFLVATRGNTQWARNARASRNILLTRGRLRMEFSLRVVPDNEKPAVLQSYLSRFKWMAWRFFPLPFDSPLATFEPIAARYPVFELSRIRPERPPESPDSRSSPPAMPTWFRYLLFQVPGWCMAALVLLLLRHYQMISFSGAVICFVAWMLKDWILYPWLRSVYQVSTRTGSKTLIGCKGVAESHLAPEGLIRVRGELWRAVAIPRELPIQTGIAVEIIDADGMTVFVRPLSDPATNDSM